MQSWHKVSGITGMVQLQNVHKASSSFGVIWESKLGFRVIAHQRQTFISDVCCISLEKGQLAKILRAYAALA